MNSVKRVATETALVVAAGIGIGLPANQLSPVGIELARDYFPRSAEAQKQPAEERLRALGIATVTLDQVAAMVSDPGYEQGLQILIDARKTAPYQAGHIPGAFQFNHYYLENYLEEVLPASQIAEEIVIYCKGGDCEDSEFAAQALMELGIATEKLSVFIGGLDAWRAAGKPLEQGVRLSGQLTTPQ